MTDEEKYLRLADIRDAMRQIQVQAERLAGNVIALEEAGMDLPSMKEIATTLTGIALGWAVPQ